MTKSTITRERLEQLADNNTICKVSWDERIELAQIALAAMDSEPVAEVLSNRPGNDTSTIDRALPVGTQLYRHAQQPVVPEEITSASAPEVSEIAAKAELLGLRGTYASYAVGWNACRAAILQAGNSPVIPDGYVIVPVEQTEDMLVNGFESEPD